MRTSYTLTGVAITPDGAHGKRLATTHMDSSITLWDVATQAEVKNFFVSLLRQRKSFCTAKDSRLF